MNDKPVSPALIDKVSSEIKGREIFHLAAFADALNRYLEIIVRRDKYNRLEWAILCILIANGGSLSPTILAKKLLRSQHSITVLVDNLEKKGHIIRERKDGDRRIIYITITRTGIDQVVKTLPRAINNWEPLLNKLSQKERALLVSLTRKFRRIMMTQINSINP